MKKRIWVPIVGLVLVSFTSIPRVTYYKVMKYVLEPSIWNESVVITGTKPESVQIRGTMIFRWCGIYKSNRIYKYIAEDLGSSYRLKLPVINKDHDECQRTAVFSINATKTAILYGTGYSVGTYNYLKESWSAPTGILEDGLTISLNCPAKGECYHIGKSREDLRDKVNKGIIKSDTYSQENIDSLTHLTINFGK